jgi:hypothetical protein
MDMRISKQLTIGAPTVIVAACGGGQQMAAIEGSGNVESNSVVAMGAITGFGSIFVNGAEYSLSGTNIQIDGRTSAESDLKLGQVVTVIASKSAAGTSVRAAKSVAASVTVAGRISAVDAASNRFTILGQPIAIDAATQIEGKVNGEPLGGLVVGRDVEVSGFADSSAVLFARSIQPRRSVTPLRVTGRVMHLDSASHRMQINDQIVDYTTATLTGFSGHSLESATVQVSAGAVGSSGELLATDVAYVDLRVPGAVGDAAELQGWVTRYVSDTDFDVDGHPITTTPTTVMQGPFDHNVSVVRLDAFVQVTGKVISGGRVEASQIVTTNSLNLGSVVTSISASSVGATGMWGVTPCQLVDAAFSVDGVPASWRDINPGDRANIYAYFNNDHFISPQQKCYVVEVEHSVVGRVDSLDASAGALVVNGQRVWMSPSMFLFGRPGITVDAAGAGSVGQVTAALHVGDRVAVSGDTTAEGDIVATGISSAAAIEGYRVTGLVHDVDAVHRQLRLGSLRVDYSTASTSGFVNGGPVEGDRVTMIAIDAPAGGLQIATGLKYAGGRVRGETLNIVSLNGLLTSVTDTATFSIEGRATAALQNPPVPGNGLERRVCDPAKLQPNLRTMLLAVGGRDDERARRIFHICPEGRRNDAYEALPTSAWSDHVIVTTTVQAVDPANFTLRLAGRRVALNPGSTLTEAQMNGGTLHTAPLRLQDLKVGDRVRIDLPAWAGDLQLIDSLWAGAALANDPDEVVGKLLSVNAPDLTVLGLTVHTSPGTAFTYSYWNSSCELVTGTAEDFWRSGGVSSGLNGPYWVTARGTVSGNVLDALSVNVTTGSNDCQG